ncbi:MAG: membrane protein insertase YidC [Spirochaetaceae bacterium]|nr:membrane protein insertase YidC [Spirochaetaceae bacterium]
MLDRNTIYALILSVLVISGGFYIQQRLFPSPERAAAAGIVDAGRIEMEPAVTPMITPSEATDPLSAITDRAVDFDYYREIFFETEVFDIVFSNRGGTIKSIRLKEHLDGGEMLEMLNKNTASLTAFNLYMGDFNAPPLNIYFDSRVFSQGDSRIVEFTKDVDLPPRMGFGETTPLTITKRYVFKPFDYLMELQVQITNRNNFPIPLNSDGFAYTLGFGPQIGPTFERLDRLGEFRRFTVLADGRRRNVRMPRGRGEVELTERISWAAISGRYFTLIGIPDATSYTTVLSNSSVDGFEEGARLFFSRPVIGSSNSLDIFRFYIGPKSPEHLRAYNYPDRNGFRMAGLDLDRALDSRYMLGWLQDILKALLNIFYGMIPNYGIAIILLTLVIRILLIPLTHKSYIASTRMAGLSPKMNEIREKYKHNPQKMNQEMGALYKKSGVNPLGGCLPLLLQMPIFFALYGLLSSHFELRGAGFISPWITDLSVADSIFNFAPGSVPIFGSDIRLLPILMVFSQIFSTKLMQAPGAANNPQMKMMTYMLPLIFLFFLYDAPSGLLLYWTASNVLGIAQQVIVNRIMKKKKSA